MPRRPDSPLARLADLDGQALAALRRLEVGPRLARCTREVSLILAGVLLVGAGAATASPAAPPAAPAATVQVPVAAPAPTPLPSTSVLSLADRVFTVDPPAPEPAPEKAPAAAAPAPRRAAPAPVPPPRVERWLPTGTGMWLHEWHRSQGGDARDVVARSQRSGFSHLYVQTGSTRKGWIGDEVLTELLPEARKAGIDVIAWDFPKLIDPEADARRMAKAATFEGLAAVAPDVETAAEGTRLSAANVTRYYAELRKRLPKHIAILATVPWPSEKRTGSYPYAETAPWSDALIPMAYWYNRSPSVVTATSMTWLARFGIPVMPVGQGYDGRLDAPYLAADPDPGGSVAAFVDTAREHGAQSISLWSWQTTGGVQWTALKEAAGTIGPAPAAEEKVKATAPGRQHKRDKAPKPAEPEEEPVEEQD